MSLFEDAMAAAVQLPLAQREQLARALGLNVHTKGPGKTLPLNQFVSRPDPSRPDPAAWRRAETGHAVLDTSGAPSAQIPVGPGAIQGIWAHKHEEFEAPLLIGTLGDIPQTPDASDLEPDTPALLHTDVCVQLALGVPAAIAFFENPPVEIRLATATYLSLLGGAENEDQVARLRRFVEPYAVLSLGPMASSRSVELMLQGGLSHRLHALDALIAATALAHEIPLITQHARLFDFIPELTVCLPR